MNIRIANEHDLSQIVEIYNQAVADVQAVLQGRVTDLDSECFEVEFTYWKR